MPVKRDWVYEISQYTTILYLGLLALAALTILLLYRHQGRLGIKPDTTLGRLFAFISVYVLNAPAGKTKGRPQ